MAKRYYELTVAGVTRQLPILNVTETLAIAGFVMLGDVELVTRCAQAMAKKVPAETEVILTAETKGIPFAAELARELGQRRYVVARKSVKAYMEHPLWVKDVSITTAGEQTLCLDGPDIERLRGRKVLLLDDVISTGGSMRRCASSARRRAARLSVRRRRSRREMPRSVRTSFTSRRCRSLRRNKPAGPRSLRVMIQE